MKILALDCESKYNKGEIVQPWVKDFYLSCVGLITETREDVIWFDHCTENPTTKGVDKIQHAVDEASVIVGHNLKFDINILRKWLGIKFNNTKLFCTMTGDFLITGQNTRNFSFSLNEVCKRYGLSSKIDKVKSFWEGGIDTYDIPSDILHEYVLDDTRKAFELYKMQQHKIEQLGLQKVVAIQNEFIYSLSDMEINGFKWDKEKAEALVDEIEQEVFNLQTEILEIIDIPYVSLTSGSQLSAILYGGLLKTTHTEWTRKEFKNGKIKEWYKPIIKETKIDGLGFKPLKNGATKKEGFYKTDKNTIKQLVCKTPAQRKIKKLLIELSGVQKSLSTLKGKGGGLLSKVQEDGRIHSSFNTTVAVTGRLSSSTPNSQNLPRKGTSPIKSCIKG